MNYPVGNAPYSVAVGDFNGDGKNDLAVANRDDDNISVLMNNDYGSFGAAVNYPVGDSPYGVVVGDFNGDGKPDLAVANFFGATFSYLYGNGDGSFQPKADTLTNGMPCSITAGDLSGDGIPDLAIANQYTKIVAVIISKGGGFYYTMANLPNSISMGDFNRDGKNDLAVADNNNNVSILMNNGAGSFGAAVNYSVAGGNYNSTAVGDFNWDGWLDLVLGNSVLLNNGDGSFQAAVNFSSGIGPYSSAVGDFNGDGKPDLAVADSFSDNVSVLLSGSPLAPLGRLTVNQGTLTPAFTPGILSYTLDVPNSVTGLNLTATLANPSNQLSINGQYHASGIVKTISPLLEGVNIITVAVANQTTGLTSTYTVTVNRAAQNPANADLSELATDSRELSPSFNPAITNYTFNVDNSVTSINITGTPADPSATMSINNQDVGSGTETVTVNLNPGDNQIPVMVRSGNGSTTKTYMVTVVRSLSNSADLSSLSVTPGILSPDFSQNTVAYQVYGAFATNRLDITAATADPDASVKINGHHATDSVAQAVYLDQGANLIPIVVTAPAGNEKAYIISVNGTVSNANLGSLSISPGGLSFAPGTTTYTINVDNSVTDLDVTAAPSDPKALVLVNGGILYGGAASFSLSPGANTIEVMVVAQDASTKTYTILVNRAAGNADLIGLEVAGLTLSPDFALETVTYAVYVSNETNSLDITAIPADSVATVTIDGELQPVGDAVTVPLNLGVNTVPVVVTAADGSTKKTYALTVNRAAALLITTNNLPAATRGIPYSTVIEGVGGSGIYTWSATGLPVGLSLDAMTGLISGTPALAGSSPVTFIVTDSNDGTARLTLSLTVNLPTGTGRYSIIPADDPAYTSSVDAAGIASMIVNNSVTGFKYFTVDVTPVESRPGYETAVFVQYRNGAQVSINATKADFDTVTRAQAGFNVQPGDVIKTFIVDDLTNDPGFNPTPL